MLTKRNETKRNELKVHVMPLRQGKVEPQPESNLGASDIPFDHDEDVAATIDEGPAVAQGQALAEMQPASIVPTMVGGEIAPVTGAPSFTPGSDPDFEDDDVDRWSFPNIKLDEGQFLTDEDEELGQSFDCIILESKPKWVMKNTRADRKDEESVFTYDRATDANSGELLQDIINDWKTQNWGVEWRHYSEKQAIMVGGPFDKALVIVNIPPTSRTVYNGAHKRFKVQHGVQRTRDYVVRCSVGKKVEIGKNTFYKWKFDFVRPVEEGELGAA